MSIFQSTEYEEKFGSNITIKELSSKQITGSNRKSTIISSVVSWHRVKQQAKFRNILIETAFEKLGQVSKVEACGHGGRWGRWSVQHIRANGERTEARHSETNHKSKESIYKIWRVEWKGLNYSGRHAGVEIEPEDASGPNWMICKTIIFL